MTAHPVTVDSHPPKVSVAAPQFAARDFIKMFAAAIGSGVAVSLVAAGVTLLLARNADAAVSRATPTVQAPDVTARVFDQADASGEPGGLFIGGACDREAVDVIERDWQIRIDGNKAEVRVMQSFLMPSDAPTSAFFEATLPRGAVFKSLKSHAAKQSREAKLMRATASHGRAAADVRIVAGKTDFTMWFDRDTNTVTTEHIPHLVAGETITVEYRYAIDIDNKHPERILNLALAGTQTESYDAHFRGKPATVAASVWVEWVGAKPQHLRGLSGDYAVETAPDGVVGLSWFSPALTAGHKLTLAWDANQAPASAIAQR
jgi:hypothetical protein